MVGELEKGLVSGDRPAERASELVEAELWNSPGKEVSRIERIVAQEVPDAAMEFVRPGTRDRADHAEAASMLGRNPGRRDAEFLNGVRRWQDQTLSTVEIAHRAAIEQVIDREVPPTVDVHVLLSEGRPDRCAHPLHSRHEANQIQRVASVQGQILDATVIHGHTDLRRPRVDLRSLAGDGHSLGDLPEFEHEIHSQALQRRQGDSRSLDRAESVRLHRGLVGPDLQLRREVVARRTRLDDLGLSGVLVGERDANPGYGRTRGIRDSAGDLSRCRLCEQANSCQQEPCE